MYNICLSNSPFVPVEFCLWPLCKVCSHFEVQIFCILLFCLLHLPETELCWNLLCCWVFLLQPIVLDTFTFHIVRIYYHVQKLAYNIFLEGASLVAQLVKNPPEMWETWVCSLDWDDPLEEGMATHSSILAWRIPWAEESGGLQSMESHRVGHDWVTKHSTAQHLLRELTLSSYKYVFRFSSVAQSCPTLCDSMDCSMPGLHVHHQLLEFT